MSKRNLDPNQVKLMTKAKQTLLEQWANDGHTLRHQDGKLFKSGVIVTYLFGIFYIIMMLATFIGLRLIKADIDPSSSDYATVVYDTRLTAVCILLIGVAIIFHRFHKYIVSGALIILQALMFLPNQALDKILTEGAWKRLVLFTLPNVLLAIAAIYMIVTIICDRVAVKRTYNDFVRRIQATHSNNYGEITTQEQWDKYVDEFLAEPVHLKPKKSLRKKAQKKTKEGKE